jgi:hypothetical protein
MQFGCNLVIHPVNLSHLGKAPAGNPLWRVVWSESRVQTLGGRHANGELGYRVDKLYDGIAACWVLEKWMSAEKFTGMTQEQYEAWDSPYRFRDVVQREVMGVRLPPEQRGTAFFVNGPYPRKGEAVDAVETVIKVITYDQLSFTDADRVTALKLRDELRKKERLDRMDAIINDAQAAPGSRVAEKMTLYGPDGRPLTGL